MRINTSILSRFSFSVLGVTTGLLLLALFGPVQAQQDSEQKLVTVELLEDPKPVLLDGITFSNGKFVLRGAEVEVEKIVRIEVNSTLLSDLRADNEQLKIKLSKVEKILKKQNEENPYISLDQRLQAGKDIDQDTDENLDLKKEIERLNKELGEIENSSEESTEIISQRDLEIVDWEQRYENLRENANRKIIELNAPKFQAKPKITSIRAQSDSMTRVMGEVLNSTRSRFDTVIVEVTALDDKGVPLDVTTTFFGEFSPRKTHYFTCDLNVTMGKISETTIRVWPVGKKTSD